MTTAKLNIKDKECARNDREADNAEDKQSAEEDKEAEKDNDNTARTRSAP